MMDAHILLHLHERIARKTQNHFALEISSGICTPQIAAPFPAEHLLYSCDHKLTTTKHRNFILWLHFRLHKSPNCRSCRRCSRSMVDSADLDVN